MRETATHYFFWKHQFGQWTLRDIVDTDGTVYNCCEQYMMVKKALLFNDKVMAENILKELNPSKQQQLGRKVSGYNQDLWDQYKIGIVWYANYLKFMQHRDLKQRLLETEDKVLVEASPTDLVWGVGLLAEDDKILITSNWKGQNHLGNILMQVRDALKMIKVQPIRV